jgi:hypothetical protein
MCAACICTPRYFTGDAMLLVPFTEAKSALVYNNAEDLYCMGARIEGRVLPPVLQIAISVHIAASLNNRILATTHKGNPQGKAYSMLLHALIRGRLSGALTPDSVLGQNSICMYSIWVSPLPNAAPRLPLRLPPSPLSPCSTLPPGLLLLSRCLAPSWGGLPRPVADPPMHWSWLLDPTAPLRKLP